MKNIIVIGANGQVGLETCLYLKEMGYNVIPVVRSKFGAVLLKKLGFNCRITEILDIDSCKSAIFGANLIIDFSVQNGQLYEIEKTLKKQISLILANCPNKVPYIYTSSIMAFGMHDESSEFKYHLFSRTIYGKWKRKGEKTAIKLGKKYQTNVFVFRFGHVYGFLQNIQLQLIQEFESGKKKYILPVKHSSTVFVCSIAEVIEKVLRSELKPSTYTLITYPFWTWEELYLYMANKNGYNIEVITQNNFQKSIFINQYKKMIGKIFKTFIFSYNETIRAYLLTYFPDYELKLRANNLINKAKIEINRYYNILDKQNRLEFRGEPKGNLVKSLTNPQVIMNMYENKIIDCFNFIIKDK